jgi:hypothetical protein
MKNTLLSPRRTKQPLKKSRLPSLLPLRAVPKKWSLDTTAIVPPQKYQEVSALSATETKPINDAKHSRPSIFHRNCVDKLCISHIVLHQMADRHDIIA